MKERRYSRYKRVDTWMQVLDLQEQLSIQILRSTVHGNSVSLTRKVPGERKDQPEKSGKPGLIDKEERAVILARSSDWYAYSLNCLADYRHGITVIIAGTHDSCIDRPVLALDVMHWYDEKLIRPDWGSLEPKKDAQGNVLADSWDAFRKTQYGHNIFVGALMQRRPDALARLETLKPSTRRRIEAEVRHLHKRHVGRPFLIWPVFKDPPKVKREIEPAN